MSPRSWVALVATGLFTIGLLATTAVLVPRHGFAADPNGPGAEIATTDSTMMDAAGGAIGVAALVAGANGSVRQAVVVAALQAYAATQPAQFAVAVLDRRTGVTVSYDPDLTFSTASIVKVDILAALALQAQDAGRHLTATEQGLADTMIRYSDNDAAQSLWWMIGDAAGLQAANARLGLTATVPGTDGYWGLTTTTVMDQVRLLDAVADPDGPLAPSSEYILGLMGRVTTDQAWGVSAAADDGESVALKNGWLEADDTGLWMVHSIGRITGPNTDLVIAILSSGQASCAAGIAMVEQVAATTRTALR